MLNKANLKVISLKLKTKLFLHQIKTLILLVKINFESGSVSSFFFCPFFFFFLVSFPFSFLLEVDEYCKNVTNFIVKGATRTLVPLCSSSLWRSEERRKIVKLFMSLTYTYPCHLFGSIHIFTRPKDLVKCINHV